MQHIKRFTVPTSFQSICGDDAVAAELEKLVRDLTQLQYDLSRLGFTFVTSAIERGKPFWSFDELY